MSPHDDLLIYAHVGDLHLTREDEQNAKDFELIISEIAGPVGQAFDFVYVPGDVAENGRAEQYALARRQIERLPMPVHIVTGDHDMEPGDLAAFHNGLGAPLLPKASTPAAYDACFSICAVRGMAAPISGFGDKQSVWLEAELQRAAKDGERCAIFMHTYPADLKGEGETRRINDAFAAREVLLVDMGHTHYNELANDGRTIFAATRSTGQIEEGPVGYSIVAIDRRTVSWRFRALGDPLPVVLITAPADRRLANDPDDADHCPRDTIEIRAVVIGPRAVRRCTCIVDDGASFSMTERDGHRYVLTIERNEGARTITVEAEDEAGSVGRETITIATAADVDRPYHADGSDADAIGAWEERGIYGTQLGPNRNGRHW